MINGRIWRRGGRFIQVRHGGHVFIRGHVVSKQRQGRMRTLKVRIFVVVVVGHNSLFNFVARLVKVGFAAVDGKIRRLIE